MDWGTLVDTNPMHDSFPISFSLAVVLSKFIRTLVLVWPPLIGRIKEASNDVIHSSSLYTVSKKLVLLTPMRMDDAMTLPFLSSQSISSPFSASISLIMAKVKTSQKSISGQKLPSERYDLPILTN